jgi:hypothetical protein
MIGSYTRANRHYKWPKTRYKKQPVKKTKAMLIHKRKPRVYERPKLNVKHGTNEIEMVRHIRILGLIIDVRLNWKVHLTEVKARAGKKLGLLMTIAHKIWGGDQKTLLRIHRMIVLSTLRYGESIYGTATKTCTENIRSDAQQGRETNIRSFRDLQNGKCREAGFPTLAEVRELNTTVVVTRILMNEAPDQTYLHQPQNAS